MVHIITKGQLPKPMQPFFLDWENIFKEKMRNLSLVPLNWEGPDLNMEAFNSASDYINWFCCHPVIPEPCRDHSFYVRDLTMLTAFIKPSLIVEFGTSVGFGSFLLSKLNPKATLITVDNEEETDFPDHVMRPMGFLLTMNGIKCTRIHGASWETELTKDFDFCFIDADHSYESVLKDSWWAWEHKNAKKYAIVWHDYNPKDVSVVGVVQAVNEFSGITGVDVYRLEDSHTAWCYKRSTK
jgi:hypothetical protein